MKLKKRLSKLEDRHAIRRPPGGPDEIQVVGVDANRRATSSFTIRIGGDNERTNKSTNHKA